MQDCKILNKMLSVFKYTFGPLCWCANVGRSYVNMSGLSSMISQQLFSHESANLSCAQEALQGDRPFSLHRVVLLLAVIFHRGH